MYKILEIANLDKGNWVRPIINWTDLKSKGYAGTYILAHQVINDNGAWAIKDNLELDYIWGQSDKAGFRTGYYITPDGVKLSYAKCFQDLQFKNGLGSSLLPAVVVGAFPPNYSPHQFEGDFIPYFNSLLVEKFGNVVLGLNKSTADFLVNSGSKLIMDFLAQDGVRIWYFRYGLTAADMNAELLASPAKKKVWIAGVAVGESQADWEATTIPAPVIPPVIPTVNPGTQTKWQKIASLLRQIADEVEKP